MATEPSEVATNGASSSDPPSLTVSNVLARCDLATSIDLRAVALAARNVEYQSKVRPDSLVLRLRERRSSADGNACPHTTVTVRSSGKITLTGSKSEAAALDAARRVARRIQRVGFPVSFRGFRISNMSAFVDAGFEVRVQSIASSRQHAHHSSYEPEIRAFLVYRLPGSKCVLNIYGSGKVVLNGVTAHSALSDAVRRIYPVLLAFRREDDSVHDAAPNRAVERSRKRPRSGAGTERAKRQAPRSAFVSAVGQHEAAAAEEEDDLEAELACSHEPSRAVEGEWKTEDEEEDREEEEDGDIPTTDRVTRQAAAMPMEQVAEEEDEDGLLDLIG